MRIKFLTLSILTILFFSGCGNENKTIQTQDIKTVFAIYPKEKNQNINRVFNAIANANNQMKLSFKVDGNLQNFNLEIGDEVKKGQLLASLDSKPYELKVSQASYALNEAQVGMKNALSNYERVKKLYVNQNASTSDIDNAKAQYDAANAKVQNVYKQLEYLKLQLSYTKLYCPIDGYISAKFVQQNENVQAGTPIVLVSDKVVDEVHVQIPEVLINKIKIEDKVEVKFDSLDSLNFEGIVEEISKFTSQREKTYLVIIKLLASNELVKSGMSSEVYFNFEKNLDDEILLVPSNTVLNDKNGYFVYVLQKEGENYLIKRSELKVGKLTTDGYEVIQGLKTTDLVLKAGMSEVFENMKVNIGNKKELGN